ncbi:hypothetical protein L3Q82_024043, partial [Scortum barcoo]
MIVEITDLSEKSRLQELVCENKGLMEELSEQVLKDEGFVGKMKDDKLVLSEQNGKLVSEVAQLKCQIEASKADTERLKEELSMEVATLKHANETLLTEREKLFTALQDLRDSEASPHKMNDASAELDLLQSQTDKKQAEIEKLLVDVRELRENEIVITERNRELTNEVAHQECLLEKKHREIEKLRATVSYFQCQVRHCQEVDEVKQQLTDVSLTESKEAEIEDALQEKEDFLNEQNRSIVDKLVHFETLSEKQNEENENLKTAQNEEIVHKQQAIDELYALTISLKQSICDLNDQLKEEEEILAERQSDVTLLNIAPEEQSQENLLDTAQVRHCPEVDELKQQLTDVSLTESKEAEIEKLKKSLHALQEKEDFLNEQNRSIVDKLVHLETLSEKQNEENENLKTAVCELQTQVEEGELLILNNKELITKQNEEIVHKQQVIDELYALTTCLKQSIFDLKEQVEMKQEEAILSERQRGESLLVAKENLLNEQNRSIVDQLVQLETVTGKQNEENENLKTAVCELQAQVEESKTIIWNRNEVIIKQNEEIVHKQQVIDELYTITISLKQSICDLKEQVEMKQEEAILSERQSDLTLLNIAPEKQRVENLLDTAQVRQAQEVDEVKQQLTDVSLTESKEAEIEKLKKSLHALQEKEDFLNEQNRSIVDKLVHLETLSEKQNEENENLKTAVCELQTQVEESKTIIWNRNEVIIKQNEEIVHKQQVINELYALTISLKQSICDLKEQLKEEEEILAERQSNVTLLNIAPEEQREENLRDTAQVRQAQEVDEVKQQLTDISLTESNEAEIEDALQEKEDFLNEQNRSIVDKLVHLETLSEKQNEENENLKTAVSDLQTQVEEGELLILNNKELIIKQNEEIVHKQQVIDELYALTTCLKQSIFDLKEQVEMKQEEAILSERQRGESLLVAKEDLLNEQKKSIVDQLVQLETVTGKQNEENENLKTAVCELQAQVEESKTIIWNRNEVIIKQNEEIVHKQQVIDELYTITISLKQSICDLKEQVEMKQEEAILSERQSDLTLLNIAPEEQREENLLDTEPEELSEENLLDTAREECREESFLDTAP